MVIDGKLLDDYGAVATYVYLLPVAESAANSYLTPEEKVAPEAGAILATAVSPAFNVA